MASINTSGRGARHALARSAAAHAAPAPPEDLEEAAARAERGRIAEWLASAWAGDTEADRGYRRYCATKLLGDGI